MKRLARRATFLVMFGLLHLSVGAQVLLNDTERFANIPVIGGTLDSPGLGVLWVVGGCVALVVALARGWPDHIGFVSLLIPPGLWTLFYCASVIYWLSGFGGRPTAISGVIVYAFVWSVIMLIAGWPNPPEGRRRRSGDQTGGH